MKSIHKYTITMDGVSIDAPVVKFLDVQMQYGLPRIWAEIDTSLPDRHFFIVPIGTGWDLDELAHFDMMTYLGTVQESSGALVWHLYYCELKESYEKLTKTYKKEQD